MKQIYISLFIFSFLFILSGCLEDPEMDKRLQNASVPEMGKTVYVENTATTVSVKATVIKENGTALLNRGFKFWQVEKDGDNTPIIGAARDTFQTGNIEKGEYNMMLQGLKDGGTYQITSFASNEIGIGYGDTISVNTNKGAGEVKTSDVDDKFVTATTARVEGVLSKKGEGEITDLGFELYIGGVKDTTYRKSDGVDWAGNDSTFYYTITDLNAETNYSVIAFARNSFGDFTNQVGKKHFKTKNGRPVLADSIEYESDYEFVSLHSKLLATGEAEIEEIGFCWTTEKKPDWPNIEENKRLKCELAPDSTFSGILTDINSGTYVKAYAKNKFGTVYTKDSILVYKKKDIPTVSLNDPSTYVIDSGMIIVSGKVQDKGKSEVKSLNLYYSTSGSPGPNNNKGMINCLDSLKENGNFTVPVRVKGNSHYYFKVFATNDSGEAFSEDVPSVATPLLFTNIPVDNASFPGRDTRIHYGIFVLDDYDFAFIVGGQLSSRYSNELYAYNPITRWQRFVDYNESLHRMSVCSKGNTAYVLGGRTSVKMITTCASYVYNRWENIQPLNDDMVCADAISFVYNDSIILLGGNAVNEALLDTIYRYDINAQTWNGAGNFPVPIANGVALTYGDSVFVGLGNSNGERGWWINTNGQWDKDNWTKLADLPTEMGNVSSGVIKDDLCYFIDNNGIIWQYNITEDKWYKCSKFIINKPIVPPEYRMFILNDIIYILVMNEVGETTFKTYDPIWDLPQEQIENEQN